MCPYCGAIQDENYLSKQFMDLMYNSPKNLHNMGSIRFIVFKNGERLKEYNNFNELERDRERIHKILSDARKRKNNLNELKGVR